MTQGRLWEERKKARFLSMSCACHDVYNPAAAAFWIWGPLNSDFGEEEERFQRHHQGPSCQVKKETG